MNRINKNTVITGLVALAVGIGIGVGGTAAKAGISHTDKTQKVATNQLGAPASPGPGFTDLAWDPFREIQDMQAQMDNLFSQMSSRFHSEAQFGNVAENPGYSLSLNVQDLKDRFVVHAFLPDTKVADVKVKLENNHTLKVNVSNQQSETSDKQNLASSISEWGQYEQVIQLPSPVKNDQMKVVRNDHELVITLPKA